MHKKHLSLTLGGALASTLFSAAPSIQAGENPFGFTNISANPTVIVADSQAAETAPDAKMSEGKCGAGKAEAAKAMESKASEGKCGAGKAEAAKAMESKAKEGSCGAKTGDKMPEGNCGAKTGAK